MFYCGNHIVGQFVKSGLLLKLAEDGDVELDRLTELYPDWQDWELIHELLVGMVANGQAEWFDPSDHGLTASQTGVTIDGVHYWHEQYAIELATDAIRSVKGLFLSRV